MTYGPMTVGAGVTVQIEYTMWVQMEKTVRSQMEEMSVEIKRTVRFQGSGVIFLCFLQ